MNSDIMRAIDISSRLIPHRSFPEQETIVLQSRAGHDDMALLTGVAGHLGYTTVEVQAGEILHHIDEENRLTDQHWEEFASGSPEWYRVSMLSKHVLAMKVGSEPSALEAMRRLTRWVGGEGALVLVFLVDEVPTDLAGWYHTVVAAPPEDASNSVEDAELTDLRNLSASATKGPWKVFHLVPGAFKICSHDNYATGGVCQPHSRTDADFVVAAVNHVRRTLDQ